MVPSTSGRALEPSAKKVVARSGRYFGWLCMSWRHPAIDRTDRTAAESAMALPAKAGSHPPPRFALRRASSPGWVASGFSRKVSVRDFIDLPCTQTLEEVRGAEPVELRIRGLDGQEEP